MDEEDVNKLLETEESPADAAGASEERTDLEDVFRWDIFGFLFVFTLFHLDLIRKCKM